MQQALQEAETMSFSRLHPAPKFLLDENVHGRLGSFLKDKGFSVRPCARGASDRQVSEQSKTEELILVTNDSDFESVPPEKVFAVILLKIPQNNVSALLQAFGSLLEHKKSSEDYASRLIILKIDGARTFALPRKEV